MLIHALGAQALVVLLDGNDPAPQELARALDCAPLAGIVDRVPARASLTVYLDPQQVSPAAVSAHLRNLPKPPTAPAARLHRIPVQYAGPDLAEVAAACGLSVAAVVELHSAATYTVAFLGFLPGFAYLDGLAEPLYLPRRATPRTRVPAGAVAIAADQTAMYPQVSPGGWHLLGHTAITLFEPQREPPALLAPGDHVRFEPQ